MIIKLNSVECLFDTRTKEVYPLKTRLTNGDLYYTSEAVNINNVCKEWVDVLSEEDILLINEN